MQIDKLKFKRIVNNALHNEELSLEINTQEPFSFDPPNKPKNDISEQRYLNFLMC